MEGGSVKSKPYRFSLALRRLRASLACLVLVLASGAALSAQASGMSAADEAAIGRVVLGDGLLGKLLAVKQEGQAMGIGKAEVSPSALTSLDALAKATLAVDPRVAGLLARHGLTARDSAAAYIALMRAVVAVQMAASPAMAAHAAAAMKATTPANVAYAKSHMAKVQAVLSGGDDADEE